MTDWDAVAGLGLLFTTVGIIGSGITLALGVDPTAPVVVEWIGFAMVIAGIVMDKQTITVEERILGED